MIRKEPRTVTIEELSEMLTIRTAGVRRPIVRDGFALLEKSDSAFGDSLMTGTPFRFLEPRFGIVRQGKAQTVINLTHRTIEAPALIFMAGGTIIQPLEFSPDLEVQGFMLENGLMAEIFPNRLPQTFNGQLQDFCLPAAPATIDNIDSIFRTILAVIKNKDYNRDAVKSLFAAILHIYDEACRKSELADRKSKSRERELFDRFIPLVNRHARRKHTIAFYADKLCITERYLSRIVKDVSGLSAKEWIDRALITEAKVMLRHSNLTIAGIADTLNFPNPGFFNKFFKRLTGITPNTYREG